MCGCFCILVVVFLVWGFLGGGGGVFPVVGGFFGWLRFFCVFCFSLFVCLFVFYKEGRRKEMFYLTTQLFTVIWRQPYGKGPLR